MITMNKWASIIYIAVLTAACGNVMHATSADTNQGGPGKKYVYSDGNGNRYEFSKNSFQYFPVKPAESSTGIYDGGDPVKNQPDPDLFANITSLIDQAWEAKADHSPEREKGTGKIEIIDGAVSSVFILKMHSTWRSDIEAVLVKMKTGK